MTFKELVMGRLQTCGSLKVPQVTAKALEEFPQEVAVVSKALEAKKLQDVQKRLKEVLCRPVREDTQGMTGGTGSEKGQRQYSI